MTLKITKLEVEAIFAAHNAVLAAAGETPELTALVAIPADTGAIERFLTDEASAMQEYLAPLLRRYGGDREEKSAS
jgi:hypothetical protein